MAIRRHLLALFVSVLILSQGFFLGSYLENLRFEQLYKELNEQRYEFDTILLEYEYMLSLKDSEKCDFIWTGYYKNLKNLEKKRLMLEKYKDEGKVNEEGYQLAKADYINTEIRYWLLSMDLEKVCKSNATTILYFYGKKETCDKCEDQAMILSYLKKLYQEDLLVFSIDGEQKGVVELLKDQYNITEYPTLIVNGEKHGYLSSNELRDIIEKQKSG